MTIEPTNTALRKMEKADTKLKRNIRDIHMQFTHVKRCGRYSGPASFALKMNMLTERGHEFFLDSVPQLSQE
jgi:hypothetical protein